MLSVPNPLETREFLTDNFEPSGFESVYNGYINIVGAGAPQDAHLSFIDFLIRAFDPRNTYPPHEVD